MVKSAACCVLVLPILLLIGCGDDPAPAQAATPPPADTGRPETHNLQAADAVGYDGQALRKSVDKMLDKVRSVTADEVQAVAKKYFGDDTLTVATLDPQPIDENAAAKKPAVHHH